MSSLFTYLVLLIVGTQFGVALASSIIVHPILLEVSRSAALEAFGPFFNKTHKAMIAMSITATVFALALSSTSGNWWWLAIAVLMHLNGPYTLKWMMPTNRRLMNINVDHAPEIIDKDLKNWGRLHAVRTLWNGLIFSAFIILAIKSL